MIQSAAHWDDIDLTGKIFTAIAGDICLNVDQSGTAGVYMLKAKKKRFPKDHPL